MNLIKTKLDGLVVLKPTVFKDNRGYFMESYNQKNINKLLGNVNFVQDNESESSRGVLRGLHFQKPPYTQAKLVRCLKGSVLDVALDLRKDSKTYGIFETISLTEENKKQLFIPKGFAHGFIVLSKSAILSYKVDNYYNPESESGIIWNDPDLNIDWKINKNEIIVSEKDKNLPAFNEIINPF
ncbi:dTDP-4-dehydrorhamnose 3,5-epimerase [Flavobacteriaceae bacterium]|nr:dTDP-4-dehydrorhamnose 3,5-epimerase [Flavobacteriaceae bacterium]MDA9551010.1 dTDP-4-dehydrorhamnose 3,5-epimerase [Flavobacteriaceae bacterium]MDC0654350.1 dTDP-4-dehydrorhamnose 3,5-epimerase [Flavobacteriaceae bacterium]